MRGVLGLLKNKKRIWIPMVCAVGILLVFIIVAYLNNASSNRLSELRDQPLKREGLGVSARIESLAADKKLKGGSPVKISVKVSNTSHQRSRYLTVKSGFQKSNFTNIRNISGSTGVMTKDGEITFANVVIDPQQTQEISFEATSFPFDNKAFVAKPSLIDTTGKTVIIGNSVAYTVEKGNGVAGGNVSISVEEAR